LRRSRALRPALVRLMNVLADRTVHIRCFIQERCSPHYVNPSHTLALHATVVGTTIAPRQRGKGLRVKIERVIAKSERLCARSAELVTWSALTLRRAHRVRLRASLLVKLLRENWAAGSLASSVEVATGRVAQAQVRLRSALKKRLDRIRARRARAVQAKIALRRATS
jgi:hypothetical protein